MPNPDTRKITSEMRKLCLKMAVDSVDPRGEDSNQVVSRALTYEQYLSGEVAERIAALTAEKELEEAGIEIVEGEKPDLQPVS